MKKKLILLVEDSKDVQDYNKSMLEDEGFAVESALTLDCARTFLARIMPDIIVLDIGMPDGNGLDFLRELRQISQIPVLMLTGYGENKDIVTGFETGCDDYLTKPYTFEVLLVRLNRLLKSAEQVPEIIEKGPITLKLTSMTALLHGKDMLLTQKEYVLLQFFIQNENRVMSAEYVYEQAWGQPMNNNAGALKNQISNLRKKLEGSGYTVSTTRGEGYCFEKE